MGTPDFAVAGLDQLVAHGYQIAGVVTGPDRPAGRGLKLQESAVKKAAKPLGCPILQPVKLKDPAFVQELKALDANVFVVVAFRMLPEVIWSMPEYGCFNLHASLLPQFPGAAPINWAVIRGEEQTGVTTFLIQKGMDTGDILLQEKIDIDTQDTAGTVHDKLMELGADVILRTVQGLEANTLAPTPQAVPSDLKMAPKIFRETCQIDFDQSTKAVYDFIRGLSPYPGAWCQLSGKTCKVFKADMVDAQGLAVGEVRTDQKTHIHIGTRDGAISLQIIQMEGKKRMPTSAFLRGAILDLEQ